MRVLVKECILRALTKDNMLGYDFFEEKELGDVNINVHGEAFMKRVDVVEGVGMGSTYV